MIVVHVVDWGYGGIIRVGLVEANSTLQLGFVHYFFCIAMNPVLLAIIVVVVVIVALCIAWLCYMGFFK